MYVCVMTNFIRNVIDIFRRPICLVIYFVDIAMISKMYPNIQRRREIILMEQAFMEGPFRVRQLSVTGVF